jgi:hypothetical protein
MVEKVSLVELNHLQGKVEQWHKELLQAQEVREFKKIFEEMYMETVEKTKLNLFFEKYNLLDTNQKKNFLGQLVKDYKVKGYDGFWCAALHPLLVFSTYDPF